MVVRSSRAALRESAAECFAFIRRCEMLECQLSEGRLPFHTSPFSVPSESRRTAIWLPVERNYDKSPEYDSQE